MSRRRLIALAAAVAAVAAGIGLWRWRTPAKPRVQFDTAAIDRGRIVAKVTATGTLSALVTVQVGSQVSGRIAALYADFNSSVKKGQRIAKIDPALFQAAVEQARANHLAAQGNLAKAKAQAVDAARQRDRARALAERKLIAQADSDTAAANADAAQAAVEAAMGSVEQARAALHQSQVNLAYTDIVSPTNGVVISRNVDVGQTVAASLQAPVLFVIAEDLAKMQVDTSVAEADVGRLRAGMGATFTVDAYPAEVFRGAVRQIRNAPQTVQNVVTYDAVIDVDNAELKLKPGMTANVTFVYAEKDEVLRLPNAALRFRPSPELTAAAGPQGGSGNAGGGRAARGPAKGAETRDQRTVWILRQGKPSPVRIRTGISDGSLTEVAEGEVQPGDLVITDAIGPPSGFAAGLRRVL
ncbi:MAG TPA: efflux RND transporter periplasmic adaptor subunit [Anaeromyxobacteraceae bacterium]|nr:efflux RND transporter periplasmic adaptor subunit [Anaeromyxobacteraceae bacterium]